MTMHLRIGTNAAQTSQATLCKLTAVKAKAQHPDCQHVGISQSRPARRPTTQYQREGRSRAVVSLHAPDAAALSRRSIFLHPTNKSQKKLGVDRSGANLMQVEVGCLRWNVTW